MRKLTSWILVGGVLCGSPLALAYREGAVRDCRALSGMQQELGSQLQDTEYFVLVDRTTAFDERLKQHVMQKAGNLVQPGVSFSVLTFSAYTQGRYVDMTAAGEVQPTVPDAMRRSLSVKRLKRYDDCIQTHLSTADRALKSALTSAMSSDPIAHANSDILASLRDISQRVRASAAKKRVVVLLSDMLEHSAVTSFYKSRDVRLLSPEEEMTRARRAGLLGDFGGAAVYVIGAGLVPPPVREPVAKMSRPPVEMQAGSDDITTLSTDSIDRDTPQETRPKWPSTESPGTGQPPVQGTTPAATYRDPRALNTLRDFWVSYFRSSNATVQAFGMPTLLVPMQ